MMPYKVRLVLTAVVHRTAVRTFLVMLSAEQAHFNKLYWLYSSQYIHNTNPN